MLLPSIGSLSNRWYLSNALTSFTHITILGAALGLITGCGTVLGLGDYDVDENATSTASGASKGDADSGGSDSGGSDGTGGETDTGGGSSGATCSDGCDDDNDCTIDVCEDGACTYGPVAGGEVCGGGVCDGVAGSASCIRCIDDQAGDAQDTGCPASAPRCDDRGIAFCAGCEAHADCDDGNDCTVDTCDSTGACVITTETKGTVCSSGVCNGVQGNESCTCLDTEAGFGQDAGCSSEAPICNGGACQECSKNSHCNDGIACTVDSCEAGTCKHVADDSACSYLGASNQCQFCNTSNGCEAGSAPSAGAELLTNGNFDAGFNGWTQESTQFGDDTIIVPYGSSGDTSGLAGVIPVHSADRLAWLGGDEDDISMLTQTNIDLPTGTVAVRVVSYVYRQTQETDDEDYATLVLRTTNGNDSVEANRWVSDDSTWQDSTDTIDVSGWSNGTVELEYRSVVAPHTGPGDDYSSFFFDSLSLKPLSCP